MNKAAIAAVVVGVAVLIVGVVLGWAVFPNMVEEQIGESVELVEDTEQYDRFVELPIAFDFKVYMMHVENPAESDLGEKPKIKEKGPYIYSQRRDKRNITRNKSKGTISYYEYQTFEYNQKASGSLRESDFVTVLNPAMNGALQILEATLPEQLKMIDEISDAIFGSKSIYINIAVGDFLFGGYKICEYEKLLELNIDTKFKAMLICLGMHVVPVRNIKRVDKDLVFTFLNHKNDTHDGHYTVYDGIDDKDKLGLIKEWQSKDYLDFWTGGPNSTCNKVGGRDAIIYPPFSTKDTVHTVYNTDICRTVDLLYEKEVEYRDVTSYQYTLGKNTLSSPDAAFGNECYCLNMSQGITYPNGCMKEGVMDLYTCYKAPILLSFPHFLWAHEDYQKSVENMSPNEEKHVTYVMLEPDTGTPLEGSKRVQFNMFVRNIQDVKFLEKYNETRVIPIVWLDEHVEISDDLYDTLYDSYVLKLRMVEGIKWGLIAGGIFIVVVTIGVVLWKRRSSKMTV